MTKDNTAQYFQGTDAQYLPDLMTKTQAAQYLQISVRALENLMASGRVPFLRITRKIVRIKKSDLLAM